MQNQLIKTYHSHSYLLRHHITALPHSHLTTKSPAYSMPHHLFNTQCRTGYMEKRNTAVSHYSNISRRYLSEITVGNPCMLGRSFCPTIFIVKLPKGHVLSVPVFNLPQILSFHDTVIISYLNLK